MRGGGRKVSPLSDEGGGIQSVGVCAMGISLKIKSIPFDSL